MRILGLLALLSTLLTAPAMAQQPNCLPFDQMKGKLASEFQEVLVSTGLSVDNTLIAIFASKDHTFTIVKAAAGGKACIMDYSKEWQAKKPDVVPEGDGT